MYAFAAHFHHEGTTPSEVDIIMGADTPNDDVVKYTLDRFIGVIKDTSGKAHMLPKLMSYTNNRSLIEWAKQNSTTVDTISNTKTFNMDEYLENALATIQVPAIIFWDGLDKEIGRLLNYLRSNRISNYYVVAYGIPDATMLPRHSDPSTILTFFQLLNYVKTMAVYHPSDNYLVKPISSEEHRFKIYQSIGWLLREQEMPITVGDLVDLVDADSGWIYDELPPFNVSREVIVNLRNLNYTDSEILTMISNINHWRDRVIMPTVNHVIIKFEFGIADPTVRNCNEQVEVGGILQVTVKAPKTKPIEIIIHHDEEDLVNLVSSEVFINRRDLIEKCATGGVSLDAASELITAYLYSAGVEPTNPRVNRTTYLAGYRTSIVAAYLSKNFDNIIHWFEPEYIDVLNINAAIELRGGGCLGMEFNSNIFFDNPTRFVDYLSATLLLD